MKMKKAQRKGEAAKKEKSLKPVAAWLFLCAAAVFLMAVIGAITRLTESGLSIVEWKPVTGALPPVNEAEWHREFAAYRQSPQYKAVNYGMELADFKRIFFWEWLHRLWGRMIGVIYALPLLFFWRRIPAERRGAFLGILLLGALQGGIGWWMVKSGLVDDPAVSHYRLAAHLMLAVLIYACLFRLALAVGVAPAQDAGRLAGARGLARASVAAVALAMTWGAFTAGLDAGLVYNDSFPYMGRHLWPSEMFEYKPAWKAFFEDHATVQFTHRALAVLVVLKALLLAKKGFAFNPPPRVARLLGAAAAIALMQAGLGVATIMTNVHIHAASAHQAGALALLTVLVWLLHEIPVVRKEK